MTDVLAVGLMKMELVTCNASDDVNEGKIIWLADTDQSI